VASWTPVDVSVATGRGGLVKAYDSGMYRSMMPSLVYGPKKFFDAHRTEIEEMAKASWEAADQMNTFPSALQKAMEIQANFYDDQGGNDERGRPYSHGAYWLKYFHPVVEKDKQGLMVSLGGSAVSNFADNKIAFGFEGNTNTVFASYDIFRQVNIQQYPDLYKSKDGSQLYPAKAVYDRTFINDINNQMINGDPSDVGAAADTQDFNRQSSGNVISKRSYSINFATGSSKPLPDGEATLSQLKDSIAITGLKVKIDGYTDDTGSADTNTALSESRAEEVKTWLQSKAHKDFPSSRFLSVQGHGSADPIASNSTASGKAANRRVSITLEE
jgi:OmpA-OmpF porin, OOP family